MKNILVIGCSWIQRMGVHNKDKRYDGFSFSYNSYGGQGLWKIQDVLKRYNDLDNYETIFVQLPTPIRNEINNTNTTQLFCKFVDSFSDMGSEKEAVKKMLDEYKQKIIEINKLHKRIIFFLYNVGGYPFRHPYDFGKNIDLQILDFLNFHDLESLYISFEGKAGYAIEEQINDDKEFWDYYYENWPTSLSGEYNKKSSLIGAPNVLIQDPHPSIKADREALDKLHLYLLVDKK